MQCEHNEPVEVLNYIEWIKLHITEECLHRSSLSRMYVQALCLLKTKHTCFCIKQFAICIIKARRELTRWELTTCDWITEDMNVDLNSAGKDLESETIHIFAASCRHVFIFYFFLYFSLKKCQNSQNQPYRFLIEGACVLMLWRQLLKVKPFHIS